MIRPGRKASRGRFQRHAPIPESSPRGQRTAVAYEIIRFGERLARNLRLRVALRRRPFGEGADAVQAADLSKW